MTLDTSPTAKQLQYIASLVGGRTEDDAYRAIARICGISLAAAKRRATRQDASRTIDALLQERQRPATA
jgi:hypothetical protein